MVKWGQPHSHIVNYVSQNHPMIEGMSLMAAVQPLSPGVIAGVVDNIRSRILDFVLAIEAQYPEAGDAAPDASQPIPAATINHFYNSTIVLGQAIVGNSGKASIGSGNVASGQVAGGDITEPAQLLPLLQALRAEAEAAPVGDERTEAIELVEKMQKSANGPRERFSVDKVRKYLALYSTLVTTVSTTVPQLEHALKWLANAVGL
jgi:AbiTii